MTKISNRIAGAMVTLFVVCGAGAAFAQSANGGGRGGDAGGAGGGATTMPATVWAVVPSSQERPQQARRSDYGPGCVTPTEGRRGPRLIGPCGPY